MLSIKNISKVYRTGSLTQKALDGVSLSLRDCEFVAVLGQSGSGKTTLLNILGGLDRYDDGDLIINGVSTKRYSDRDWDSYRNHTVGFVFQSYNLIPHQTVLKNVELALTISGISAKERAARATQALEKVGLSEHIHKKPSQLSGGQMQRVAIARALVNDPDILLADEPTGALDSDTSLQVMDLLKEVAEDRLVVMVTHNPELAEAYATRIVTLKDGQITSDSDPYEPEESETVHKNLGRASMSFFTALALSFNNLWTKKARTILVAFAGSIGIIGIAMILAMSTGANEYIRSVEEESLQSYPLSIADTSINLLSLFTEAASAEDEAAELPPGKDVQEWRAVTSFFSGISANDLKSLKEYFESDECDIYDHVQALEYSYNLTPQIFKIDSADYRQVNPDRTFSALGITGSADGLSGLFSSMMSTDSFSELPRDEDLLHSSYELKAGSWPQDYDECVVLLSPSGRVTDMALYILGLKDPDELNDMTNSFFSGIAKSITDQPAGAYSYDELMGAEFKVLAASELYAYDEQYKVWSDRSSDKQYMMDKLNKADTMRVVGVVQPLKSSSTTSMSVGFAYSAKLTDRLIYLAEQSEIVKAQLSDPSTDVFTGEAFGSKSSNKDFDLSSLLQIDEDAISKALDFDISDLDLSSLDLSSIDFSGIDLEEALAGTDLSQLMPSLSQEELSQLISGIKINMTSDQMKEIFSELLKGFQTYAADDGRADINGLASAFGQYLRSDEARKMIVEYIRNAINENGGNLINPEVFAQMIQNVMAGYPEYLASQGLPETSDYLLITRYLRSDEARAIMSAELDGLVDELSESLFNDDNVKELLEKLASGYEQYADENDLPTASYIASAFTEYLSSDEVKKTIAKAVADAFDENSLKDIESRFGEKIASSMSVVMNRIMGSVSDQITSSLGGAMASLASGLSANLLDSFNFDPASLSEMFKNDMTAEQLKDLMVSLLSDSSDSYASNLGKLGYASIAEPSLITIYPKDFDSKNHIKKLLSDYNKRMEDKGESEKVIHYTDVVDTLMSSVTVIVNVISYVLIAFVAVSLVVSSIMIGVITYISVLERRKEIGILRAIGASKRNISQVFNAETFIIGSLAGMFGVAITQLLIIPANLIIHSLSNVEQINAVLPPLSALLLILLSIGLTLLGGLIPSRKAAKSDPVTALRSE